MTQLRSRLQRIIVGRSAKSVRPAQQEEIYTKRGTLQVEEATLFFQNLMNMRGIPASTCFRSDKTSITAPTLLDSCFTTDIIEHSLRQTKHVRVF